MAFPGGVWLGAGAAQWLRVSPQPAIDFFTHEVMIHPVTNRPADKRSFIPSLIEKEKVRVGARRGWGCVSEHSTALLSQPYSSHPTHTHHRPHSSSSCAPRATPQVLCGPTHPWGQSCTQGIAFHPHMPTVPIHAASWRPWG